MRGLEVIACVGLSASVGTIADSTASLAGLTHVGGIKVVAIVAEETHVLIVRVTGLTIADSRTVKALPIA